MKEGGLLIHCAIIFAFIPNEFNLFFNITRNKKFYKEFKKTFCFESNQNQQLQSSSFGFSSIGQESIACGNRSSSLASKKVVDLENKDSICCEKSITTSRNPSKVSFKDSIDISDQNFSSINTFKDLRRRSSCMFSSLKSEKTETSFAMFLAEE